MNNVRVKWFSVLLVVCGVCLPALAVPTISFLSEDGFVGVDAVSGWSTSESTSLLSSSWSLLGGTATVTAYRDGGFGTLSHRGTRGLGVVGGERDEIDSRTEDERIEITFLSDQLLSSVEVRSLFSDEGWSPGTEYGTIDFYLDNSLVHSEFLTGQESLGGGNDGDVAISYLDPLLIDTIVYYVPAGFGTTSEQSEFAVARLDIVAVPVPSALLLAGIGTGAIGWLKRRRVI